MLAVVQHISYAVVERTTETDEDLGKAPAIIIFDSMQLGMSQAHHHVSTYIRQVSYSLSAQN